jgi:group I intron endonuclease
MTGGIYTIRFAGVAEFYVGKAASLHKRRVHHEWLLRNGRHNNARLQGLFNKHGAGAMSFVVEEVLSTEGERTAREQWWLDTHMPSGVLLNFRRHSRVESYELVKKPRVAWNKGLPSPTRGIPRTEEVRRRISDTWQSRPKKEKPPRIPKPRGPQTPETRAKISAARKGIKFSSETIEKMRQAALRRVARERNGFSSPRRSESSLG